MQTPLLEALDEHAAMLQAASHLFVGFSGGRDSHCLLHALVTSSRRLALPHITAIHINHGLHVDADAWTQHCRDVAQDLEVELIVEHVAVSSDASLEAQARTARYSAFERYLCRGSLLLLAHHLDDQVETVLFRLIRGAGASGLSGIPQARSLGMGALFRPLLGVSRTDIEDYAATFSLGSVDDPSNADTSLDRNFLRHRVLPMIAERWPGYRSGIARTSHIMAALDQSLLDPWYECSLGTLSLDIDQVESESLHTQIRSKLRALSLQSPAHDALKEFCRQCVEAGNDKVPTLDMASYALVCWRLRVQLIPTNGVKCQPEEVSVGESIDRPWGRLTWTQSNPGLPEGSRARLRQAELGEKIKFPGRPRRALRDCMQEAGIAPYWRSCVPILCKGDEVVAVPAMGCTDQVQHIFNGNSEGLVPVWRAPKICIGN